MPLIFLSFLMHASVFKKMNEAILSSYEPWQIGQFFFFFFFLQDEDIPPVEVDSPLVIEDDDISDDEDEDEDEEDHDDVCLFYYWLIAFCSYNFLWGLFIMVLLYLHTQELKI